MKDRDYNYLKKTLLVSEGSTFPDRVGYFAHMYYTPWMVYKAHGEIHAKLNLFQKSVVKDDPFKITDKMAEEAWKEFLEAISIGTFPEYTYHIQHPDDVNEFNDDYEEKLEAFQKTDAYKEEVRKEQEGIIHHQIISIAPQFSIPEEYKDAIRFYWDQSELQ